jgi:hypothetical protein
MMLPPLPALQPLSVQQEKHCDGSGCDPAGRLSIKAKKQALKNLRGGGTAELHANRIKRALQRVKHFFAF